jgi:hypothetical protein
MLSRRDQADICDPRQESDSLVCIKILLYKKEAALFEAVLVVMNFTL